MTHSLLQKFHSIEWDEELGRTVEASGCGYFLSQHPSICLKRMRNTKESVIRIDSLKTRTSQTQSNGANCSAATFDMIDTKSMLLKITKYIKLHKDCEKFDDYMHILDPPPPREKMK